VIQTRSADSFGLRTIELDYPEPTLVTQKRKQILLVQQTGVR